VCRYHSAAGLTAHRAAGTEGRLAPRAHGRTAAVRALDHRRTPDKLDAATGTTARSRTRTAPAWVVLIFFSK
jgi:hypothetical protein